jgi:guanine deaminase
MENLNSSLLEPIITPRFALSCSEGLMTKLGDLAKSNNLAIQTHISENRGEMQIVKDLFPRCKDYLEVYENHNLIGNRTLLAHGIHLSDDELSRMCNVGASVVHCPTSNTNLMSGFFDAKEMISFFFFNFQKISLNLNSSILQLS